jgi:hypothetical protein
MGGVARTEECKIGLEVGMLRLRFHPSHPHTNLEIPVSSGRIHWRSARKCSDAVDQQTKHVSAGKLFGSLPRGLRLPCTGEDLGVSSEQGEQEYLNERRQSTRPRELTYGQLAQARSKFNPETHQKNLESVHDVSLCESHFPSIKSHRSRTPSYRYSERVNSFNWSHRRVVLLQNCFSKRKFAPGSVGLSEALVRWDRALALCVKEGNQPITTAEYFTPTHNPQSHSRTHNILRRTSQSAQIPYHTHLATGVQFPAGSQNVVSTGSRKHITAPRLSFPVLS